MTHKFAYFFLTIIFCLSSFVSVVLAQNEDRSTISVQATGEIEIPADLLYFNVTINQFQEDPKIAFERHKEQENFLTNLLISEEIPDQQIIANPISIFQTNRHNQQASGYETRQQVTIQLKDVTLFESMQLTLIENGFTNFSGSFSSSNLKEARDEALDKAVKEAIRKAEILARAAGKRITDVQSVQYGTNAEIFQQSHRLEMAFDAGSGSLLQFERMIPVQENVNVIFLTE